jgi:signal transduction histidine kinase
MTAAREPVLGGDGAAIQLLIDPSSLTIADASRPTLELLGYRREELLGRPITDIECSLADTFFWKELRRGDNVNVQKSECSYRCASGELLSATKTVSCVVSDGTDWLVVSAEPLASGPRLEDQLASVAALLRATLEATADGILVIDCVGKIVNMNRRFARMWGLPDALLFEHRDSAIFDYMAALFTDSDAYLAGLASIALDADGETFGLLGMADGRFFERRSLPAKHGSHVFGRVFSFTDVTERKRAEAMHESLEAQLRESQKMEAIGTLAGGIAHDFNNIIATILGNTELARQDASANPAALESLDEIRKAGNRARDLVAQILSFSRRQPTARKPVPLSPIIQESVRLLRATLPGRVKIDVHCEADVPAVRADATQIEQVVINLCTNAMHAMRGGPGRIDIGLDVLTAEAASATTDPVLRALQDQHPGRRVRLTVSDNGQGMDETTRARIFEPFFTTKAPNEGTGLGLSVVHGIVRGHEGAITVRSQPGVGTTFTLYLPASDVEGPPW